MENKELIERMMLTEAEFLSLSELEQLPFYRAVLPKGLVFYKKKPVSKTERRRLEWLNKVKEKNAKQD